jgi:hypothetical protein
MSATTCTICGKPSHDGFCCHACLGAIRRALHDVPELLRELDTQTARQARHGQSNGSRSAERPSPFDLRASAVRDDLRTVMVGWTRDICEANGGWPGDQLAAMAGRLAGHDWRRHEACDEFADELRWALGQVRGCIDLAPERVYLGPCVLTGEGCRADIWARPGNPSANCWECGAEHIVVLRQAALLAECADRLAHAELIGRALTSLAAPVDGATIRQWAHRGRIIAKGHDQQGRPLYRIGDARELAATIRARTSAPQDHTGTTTGRMIG